MRGVQMEEATMTTCKHAAAGCNYPEGQCPGHCHFTGDDSLRPGLAGKSPLIECHTRGPIVAQPVSITFTSATSNYFAVGIEGTNMAVAVTGLADGSDESRRSAADAYRLAACWNVCEGVDTLELETAARYKALATGYRKRTEQRDMLLKALRMARWCVQADLDSLVETCRHPDGSMEAADAALVATYAEKLGIIDMAIENGGAA